jgi:hypothetical protein
MANISGPLTLVLAEFEIIPIEAVGGLVLGGMGLGSVTVVLFCE